MTREHRNAGANRHPFTGLPSVATVATRLTLSQNASTRNRAVEQTGDTMPGIYLPDGVAGAFRFMPLIDEADMPADGQFLKRAGNKIVGAAGGGDFVDAKLTTQVGGGSGGDHLTFDTIVRSVGSSVTLDISTPYTTTDGVDSIGRFTLAPGTYLIDCAVPQVVFSFSGGFLQVGLYDADSGTRLSQDLVAYAMPNTNAFSASSNCSALLRLISQMRIEARISTSSSVSQIGVGGPAPSLASMRVVRLG